MSKRHKKTKMFAEDSEASEGASRDGMSNEYEAPAGKRLRGKSRGKAKRANQKTAYYDD